MEHPPSQPLGTKISDRLRLAAAGCQLSEMAKYNRLRGLEGQELGNEHIHYMYCFRALDFLLILVIA